MMLENLSALHVKMTSISESLQRATILPGCTESAWKAWNATLVSTSKWYPYSSCTSSIFNVPYGHNFFLVLNNKKYCYLLCEHKLDLRCLLFRILKVLFWISISEVSYQYQLETFASSQMQNFTRFPHFHHTSFLFL